MKLVFLDKLEYIRPFTEREAWSLFKIVALGEAVGWTLLITGLLIRRYNLPSHTYSLLIAGRIHGILFLAYFGILLAVYSSLGWSRRRFGVAVLAGVVPYGSLIFEQWVARKHHNQTRQVLLYSFLIRALSL